MVNHPIPTQLQYEICFRLLSDKMRKPPVESDILLLRGWSLHSLRLDLAELQLSRELFA